MWLLASILNVLDYRVVNHYCYYYCFYYYYFLYFLWPTSTKLQAQRYSRTSSDCEQHLLCVERSPEGTAFPLGGL